ncbi:conserved hypothetical protein [Gammaproteobacteria bacterium]
MQYPLPEKIGDPELFIGREQEFKLINNWLERIPARLAQSRVIAARRKSGKTAFIQRIFNRLWSENGAVIPFYLDIPEKEMWLPDFSIDYYCAFVSQYISFLERDPSLVTTPISLDEIRAYGIKNSIKLLFKDAEFIREGKHHDLLWKTASSAPHRFAAEYDLRFVVILDEFQNITQFVYPDQHYQTKPIESMAGSYLSLSESKLAPMLVTGSYPGLLIKILGKYLKGGRLTRTNMAPYLTPDEGLQAVYKYAEVYDEPITNETAAQINELCMSDPFFIACLFRNYYDAKDLTTSEGVIAAVEREVSSRESEMSGTWNEYIMISMERLNGRETKQLLLHLSKYNERYWTPKELKDVLHLDSDIDSLQKKLVILAESDMIERGNSDIHFRGLNDGSLNLILRHRFEEEIQGFEPDFKPELEQRIAQLTLTNRSLQGRLNNLSGKVAEHLLATAMRSRKRFGLHEFFDQVVDTTRLNIISVKERFHVQREDGKNTEIDIVAYSECGRTVLIEVKKTEQKTGVQVIRDFQDKVRSYQKIYHNEHLLPAFLSLGGFTDEGMSLCQDFGIATVNCIRQF